jgi:hypothetical protein
MIFVFLLTLVDNVWSASQTQCQSDMLVFTSPDGKVLNSRRCVNGCNDNVCTQSVAVSQASRVHVAHNDDSSFQLNNEMQIQSCDQDIASLISMDLGVGEHTPDITFSGFDFDIGDDHIITSLVLRMLVATIHPEPNVEFEADVACVARDVQFRASGRHTTADRALPVQRYAQNWSSVLYGSRYDTWEAYTLQPVFLEDLTLQFGMKLTAATRKGNKLAGATMHG